MIFDNVQLEKHRPPHPSDTQLVHLQLGGQNPTEYIDQRALRPEIRFTECRNLVVHLGHCVASAVFERSSINTVTAPGLRGELVFNLCRFRPDVREAPADLYSVASTLGTRFINCTVHAPVINAQVEPEMVNRTGFLEINGSVRHYHLNTGLGKEVISHFKDREAGLAPEFIAKLRAHHTLEE